MHHRSLHDGREDGLEPLESLALGDVRSFAGLLRAMSKTAFSGRELGRALDVLLSMSRDENCHVVLTLSGAMTVAKQGRIICDLIDRGIVDSVVSTGALMAHGLTESIGCAHYRYDPTKSDETLFEQGYNRIYDTLEMESNLNHVEELVRKVLTESEPDDGVWSSARLCVRSANGSVSQPTAPAFCGALTKRTSPFSSQRLPIAKSGWMFQPGPWTWLSKKREENR